MSDKVHSYEYETLLVEFDDGVCVLTLNRPEKYNTLRPSLLTDLDDALCTANTDNEVKVISSSIKNSLCSTNER